ncbi:unnamed protein product, partial [Choristocarpus tenellus]
DEDRCTSEEDYPSDSLESALGSLGEIHHGQPRSNKVTCDPGESIEDGCGNPGDQEWDYGQEEEYWDDSSEDSGICVGENSEAIKGEGSQSSKKVRFGLRNKMRRFSWFDSRYIAQRLKR